jgi:L-amino acid N-acyltransferase YncA
VTGGPTIRPLAPADTEPVAEIYVHYVQHTAITFDLEAPSAADWAGRLAAADGLPWLGCEDGGRLVGFAYAGRFRPKRAYEPTVETTIYLHHEAGGRGLGRLLYGALLDRVAAGGFHTAVAGVTLPNPASVALHERLGFTPVGVFSEVGHKLGRWHDVGFWLRRF